MTFFLGTHQVCWLARLEGIPLFVSRRRLADYKTLPRAVTDWALDSGGFTELGKFGGWSIEAAEYVAEVRRYRDEVGRLQWASPMDWMCEPPMLQRTGLSVAEHQRRTIANYLDLCGAAPDVPWVPVLQGWRIEDYLRHVEQYQAVGVDLYRLPLVGLGTVCRRQGTVEAERLVRALGGIRLHGYGFKTSGLARVCDAMVSADSMAWSAGARRKPPLPGCRHQNCANCAKWALLWRRQLLARIAGMDEKPRQFALAM